MLNRFAEHLEDMRVGVEVVRLRQIFEHVVRETVPGYFNSNGSRCGG